MRPRRRTTLLTATLLVTLTGCTPLFSAEDPKMDHDEAYSELDSLFKVAQDAVGGEWESADSGALDCALPSGDEGAQYAFARKSEGIPKDQQQAIIDLVVAAWTAKELAPTLGSRSSQGSEITTVRYPASGWGVDGMYFEFRLSERSAGLIGQTRCVPGDLEQINRDYHDSNSPTPTSTPSPPS